MVSSYYGGNRSDVPDGTAPSDGTGGDTEQAQKNNSAHDQPFDPMDSALDHAAALLEQQGCTLEVLARADDAVQVAIADADTHPSGNTDLLKNAMVASGFALEGDWYVLEQEETTP